MTEPIKININKNGTKTLHTAEKYCDYDIAISVNVPNYEKELTERTIKEYINNENTIIGKGAFWSCRNLKTVDLGVAQTIDNSAFSYCYSLTKLILRNSTVCILKDTTSNVFISCFHLLGKQNNTYNPEGLHDGYIYVPKNLIEKYKNATNWIVFADRFRAIEDYGV